MNSNNKRIVKNTVYLYIRMLVTICVTLYTSRVVLDVLGLSDYGLYNVVGGTLTFFTFINSALSGCTQRYLNIAIGKGDDSYTKIVFSTAFTIHVALAVAFFIVMLIVGGALLENVLVIEPSRMGSARWVLLITLVLVCLSFTIVPFDSAIIAHEKMNFYAFISIFDVSIKLLVVYTLLLFKDADKVVLYALLQLGGVTITSSIYFFYCKSNFSEISLKLRKEVDLMKELFSFTGWSLLGNLTFMLSTHGINIMLNMFYGTVVNAAWGVATQVNGVLGKFSSSFQVASSPQIMKYYAAEEYDKMFSLTRNASKYAAFLVALIGIPTFIEIGFVLSKWLVEVPEHAVFFVRLMIVQTVIAASSFPISRALVATARIKESCIFDLVVRALSIVASFLVLKNIGSMHLALYIQILPQLLCYWYMLHLLKRFVNFPIYTYIPMVVIKTIIVIGVACVLPIFFYFQMEQGWVRCIWVFVVSVISMGLSVYLLGIDDNLRRQVNKRLQNTITRITLK